MSLAAFCIGSNSSPNTLTAISPRTPAEQFVEAHLDRLRELVDIAGQLIDGLADLLDQRLLGQRGVRP